MIITTPLFEAGLKCLTKSFLRSLGETGTGNAYADWVRTQAESYHNAGTNGLMAGAADDEYIIGSPETENWKTAKWRLAVDLVARAENLESSLHVVERSPSEGRGQSGQFTPVRFVFTNKLTRSDKLLLAFDALVLSEMLGRKVGLGKIIHGDNHTKLKVKISALAGEVRKLTRKIATMLSTPSPPDLVLNRHCAECEFQARCRQKAIEKDDLSLLSSMTEKERKKFNSKGIFTLTQLSYTFRPRRRPKRLAGRHEKYHHSLKALAIRERKIYIVGSPELKVEGTPVFLDVEGLPDRDFYYLIGLRVTTAQGVVQHSLWADTANEEKRIWADFLNILSEIKNPVLVHYGSFETTFLKRMSDRHAAPQEGSAVARAIKSSINLLSIVFAQVYFPAFSNGLKEIARYLQFSWADPYSSGLQSIVWHYQWEQLLDQSAREKLIRYNADDCEALSLVAQTVSQLAGYRLGDRLTQATEADIVLADSIEIKRASKWRAFSSPLPDLEHINTAAHWNYQRDRVYVRSGSAKRKPTRQYLPHKTAQRADKVVEWEISPCCPECKGRTRRKGLLRSRTVQDMVFGRYSLKRRLVKYVFQEYHCRKCRLDFGVDDRFLHTYKYGWHLVAYFVFHFVGLCIPQLTVLHSFNRLFGFNLSRSTLNNLKIKTSEYYSETKLKILDRIVCGSLVHADETRANIKGKSAYVWVLTNLNEVVYILAESREGEVIRKLLSNFKGVLVSDFYAAYDSIECPQQKCLIHLMRDLNDEILDSPFDEELKTIVAAFAALLKPMVETIDRRGLKKRFLGKHLIQVERFYRYLAKSDFQSDTALKCKQRFEKNRDKLFTFLRYSGVPWNNNNAEHAIKAFAKLRDVISGTSTKKGVDEYLTLLTIRETCEYQGLDFLDFLRSGERDIVAFAYSKRRRSRCKTICL
jgi:predicted RecB family nuclease